MQGLSCTIVIVHACTMIIVHAGAMIVVNACTMILLHACTMIVVHVSCPTRLVFRESKDGGPAMGKQGRLVAASPPIVSRQKTQMLFIFETSHNKEKVSCKQQKRVVQFPSPPTLINQSPDRSLGIFYTISTQTRFPQNFKLIQTWLENFHSFGSSAARRSLLDRSPN